MPHWQPINRYRTRPIKAYSIAIAAGLGAIFLLGNVITALVRDSVTVSKGSYILKEGFPLFTDGKEYISLVGHYPYNPGVSLKIHRLSAGESYWDVAYRNNISIDTIVAANPFIQSLVPIDGIEIVVPSVDGVLMALDDVFDVRRMRKRLNFSGATTGDYLPTIFKIISADDIRFVFFKGAKPAIVNNSLEQLYRLKNIFQIPLNGFFTSLFGDRQHPFLLDGSFRYHNGVDIVAHTGAPIHPAREGMIIFTGERGGFGVTVMVQHDEGYTTMYGHLMANSTPFKVGDWVTKKDVIGRVGSTGWSTGPHLHFTIMRHGYDLNPLMFIW